MTEKESNFVLEKCNDPNCGYCQRAEWTKALHEATSYSGKLYAKYKLRELKK